MATTTNEIGTRARWYISSSSARNLKMTKLKSYSETDDSDLELAYNTADDGPVGVIDKPGGGALELEYYHDAGNPEVAWRGLKKRKEYFSLTKEIVGSDGVKGERIQYNRCRVANVVGAGDDQASHMQTIKIVWSTREDL